MIFLVVEKNYQNCTNWKKCTKIRILWQWNKIGRIGIAWKNKFVPEIKRFAVHIISSDSWFLILIFCWTILTWIKNSHDPRLFPTVCARVLSQKVWARNRTGMLMKGDVWWSPGMERLDLNEVVWWYPDYRIDKAAQKKTRLLTGLGSASRSSAKWRVSMSVVSTEQKELRKSALIRRQTWALALAAVPHFVATKH